jgi:hypothetical protein
LLAIKSGSHGGTLFEIFSAVCPNQLAPIISPITIHSDPERRQAHVRIGAIRAEPIKNPVTGEEHRARIVLPEGFEYKEAEMANAVMLRVGSEAPMVFEHQNTYAQLHNFD